jgi:hypothetical protein
MSCPYFPHRLQDYIILEKISYMCIIILIWSIYCTTFSIIWDKSLETERSPHKIFRKNLPWKSYDLIEDKNHFFVHCKNQIMYWQHKLWMSKLVWKTRN